MPVIVLGLALGALSGTVTYALTTSPGLAGLVAGLAALLTWVGIAALVWLDNN